MHELIREVQALAQSGLHNSDNPFDRQRYQRLRAISFELMALLSEAGPEAVARFFIPDQGYATPKVDLRACVVHQGRVLLVKERMDGCWSLPGGWADQNETPIEGITREVREESGFEVRVTRLYAVKDRDRHPYHPKYPTSIYKLFFLAEIIGGEAGQGNEEIEEVGFFDPQALPPLSTGRVLAEDIELGLEAARSAEPAIWCD
ncbi:NUDIX hydrolase [Ferrimonas balearica]|uniref:NUDIX hydrolase n=1 Tax=Ferrimonas balearica TaxID=44012 RepID=UPI001C9916EB|nr:NUDIX hydrolase [Ferrimonas balearica]MBY5991176.1 NUDIX hydrolase [Ferrimonas balearica]